MTKQIAYLASHVTMPGSPTRREDGFEHDRMMAALRPPFAERGMELSDVSWDAETDWNRFDGALIGTTWDYWDRQAHFLQTLEQIGKACPLFNPAPMVRWNSHKGYLRDLEAKGARLIPTVWIDTLTPQTLASAFGSLSTDRLVAKRQVGAGAAGQFILSKDDPCPETPHAMMAQPFIPSIQTEGEYSFIFIDGAFSHALIKRAKAGDYRIQSSYGGTEEAISPASADLDAAHAMMATLDSCPLYARVDMVRAGDGGLYLMELELIEPYLYPLEGPDLGRRMAEAVARRLSL
jgi:hypothetical protein